MIRFYFIMLLYILSRGDLYSDEMGNKTSPTEHVESVRETGQLNNVRFAHYSHLPGKCDRTAAARRCGFASRFRSKKSSKKVCKCR